MHKRVKMSEHTHHDQAHAVLGASGAHRWMNCPGSVAMAKEIGHEETESIYAREGTAAHAVAEKCLRSGLDPEFYVGQKIEGIKVTREMAASVRIYVDRVRMVAKAAQTEPLIEVRFDLSKGGPEGKGLEPPEPMFGTADAVVWDELHGRTLWVLDYKHGQGVTVEAENNPQLMYYALGAVLKLGMNPPPRKIKVVIVQPRASHPDGIIRDWEFEWADLVAFKNELMVAAYATQEENAPLKTGSWCRFCPARAVCPAQEELAVAVAQQEFGAMVPATEEQPGSLPAPYTLTEDELLEILDKSDYVIEWLREVQRYADNLLETGTPLPGWKLVAKRANRKWNDEEEVIAFLRGVDGVEEEDYLPRKLLSPNQTELLLRRVGAELPEHFTNREVSGYNRVREEDPRRAICPAGAEFTEAQEG